MTDIQSDRLFLELARAARTLIDDVVRINTGEVAVITGDTHSDQRVLQATAQAVSAAGGVPVLIRTGLQADSGGVIPSVAAAGAAADAWIDFSREGYLYTPAQHHACANGVRYVDYLEVDVERLVRMLGKPEQLTHVKAMREQFTALLPPRAEVEILSSDGTHLSMLVGEEGVGIEGALTATPGGIVTPPGTSSWTPPQETLQGVFVVDGCLWPPDELGVLTEPVTLALERGEIVAVDGGREAKTFGAWLDSFDSPELKRVVHATFGHHPGITRFTENMAESERRLGTFTLGFGGWIDRVAPAHFDGVLSSPTVVVNGVTIQEDGQYVDSGLAETCRALGVPGY